MDHGDRKPEHAGPKKGQGAYWGRREAAKKKSSRQRRENNKVSVLDQTLCIKSGSIKIYG
jgi:hypothetical protein